MTVRNAAARHAGATEDLVSQVDDYEVSDLSPALKAALRFTDALVEDPTRWSKEDMDEVRRHYSDAEISELALEAAMYCGLHRFIGAMRVPYREDDAAE